MYPQKISKVQSLAAATVILLLVLGGGAFAYATRANLSTGAGATQLDQNTTQQPLVFQLVPVTIVSPPSNFRNGSGEAVIQAEGTTVHVEAAISGATPNADLVLALSVQGPNSNPNIITWKMNVGSDGGAQLSNETTLQAGTYLVGVKVFDITTFGTTTEVLVSNPATALLTVSDQISSTSSTSSTSTTSTSSTFSCPPGSACPTTTTSTTTSSCPPQSACTTTTTTTQRSTPPPPKGYFTFLAVPLSNAPAGYLYGQGYAYVSALGINPAAIGGTPAVSGSSVAVLVSITGANPNTQYDVVLLLNGVSYPVGSAKTESNGQFRLEATFAVNPGTYQAGLIVQDLSTFGSPTTVLVSYPSTQTITVYQTTTTTTSTTTKTTTSTTNSVTTINQGYGSGGLAFNLNGITVGGAATAYKYGSGRAYVLYHFTTVQVNVEFTHTNPNTEYNVVMTINGANTVLGVVKTGDEGNAGIQTELSLSPGTYQIGFIIQDMSSFSSPTTVLVSNPATGTMTIVAPPVVTTTTTTSTTSQYTTYTATTLTTTTFNSGGVTFRLIPVAIPNTPPGYKYGSGEAGVRVTPQGSLLVAVQIEGAAPNTQYGVILTANGTAHNLGFTDSGDKGNAVFTADLLLVPGTYQIGLQVQDTSSFSSPTTVLISDPPTANIKITESVITTTIGGPPPGTRVYRFTIIPAVFTSAAGTTPNAVTVYKFGHGEAEMDVHGITAGFVVQIYNSNPTTQYTLEAVINGSAVVLGNTVSRNDGWANIRAAINLNPGRYQIGLILVDPKTFGSPVTVMQSDPISILVQILPPILPLSTSVTTQLPGASTSSTSSGSSTSSSSSSSESTSSAVTTVSTVSAGASGEAAISQATQAGTIPATIVIANGQPSVSVLDQRFSVSIGQVSGSGYVVTISGNNVTGPRTLLINLTGASAFNFKSNSLNITLDGSPVSEASSLTQVLNPVAGDPARYAIVITSSGEQLLVSIPHFSIHTLAFNPVPITQIQTAVQSILAVNAETLLIAAIVVTALFAAAYKGRKRFYSIAM